MHAIGRLGQSCRLFCPLGQMYRGFENPRLFKDRPTDGNPAATPHPSIYQRVQQRMQPCVGMPTFRNNLQQHGATYYFAVGMAARAPAATHAPIYARIDFRSQLQPRPKDGPSIAGVFRPTQPPAQIHYIHLMLRRGATRKRRKQTVHRHHQRSHPAP